MSNAHYNPKSYVTPQNIVSQVAAAAGLIAPILGSVVYVTFGLEPVMITSIVCFFLTAGFECFIRLEYIPYVSRKGDFETVKSDFP